MQTKKKKPFCFICGSTELLVGLDIVVTKQKDRSFRSQIYYQVCEMHIPKLLKFLSDKKGLVSFDLKASQ